MTAPEQQATWPPPIGTRITITVTCCGRTSETRTTWTGDEQPVTLSGCLNSIKVPHKPHVTATWSKS